MYDLQPEKKPIDQQAVPDKKRNNTGCLILVILIAAGVLVLGTIYGPDSSAYTASSGPDRSDACFMSQKFVEQNLKSPSTAEFPLWTEENCRATQSGGTWKVRSFVDSQNSFGAMLRSDYGVEMRYSPDRDTWALLDIMIIDP